MRARSIFLGLVTILSLTLYGCGSDLPIGSGVQTQAQAKGLSQGWTRYGDKDSGFNIDLPDGWMKLDLTGSDIETSILALGGANPELASFLDNQTFKAQVSNLVASGIKLMLYDTSANVAALKFATNMNVVSQELPSELTLAQVVSADLQEVQSAAGKGTLKNITQDPETLGTLSAEKLSYTYGMFLPDNTHMDIHISQYVVLDGKTEYVITFTTTINEAKLRSITFDAIANTFRPAK